MSPLEEDKMLYKTIIFILIIFMPLNANASSDAEKLISSFLGPDGISDKESVYIGEMLQAYTSRPTLGESLPKGSTYSLRILESSENHAIYSVLIKTNGNSKDWYIYLKKDEGVWKLQAVRTLALSGIFDMVIQKLSNKKRNEEEQAYQNMLLTTKLDSELKNYFLTNKDAFDKLVQSHLNGDTEKEAMLIRQLYLNNILKLYDYPNIIDVSIGGILDNSVGYLYVPKGFEPPVMNADEYIYIERITDHWYIYKTT
jgi:hypothetical protein